MLDTRTEKSIRKASMTGHAPSPKPFGTRRLLLRANRMQVLARPTSVLSSRSELFRLADLGLVAACQSNREASTMVGRLRNVFTARAGGHEAVRSLGRGERACGGRRSALARSQPISWTSPAGLAPHDSRKGGWRVAIRASVGLQGTAHPRTTLNLIQSIVAGRAVATQRTAVAYATKPACEELVRVLRASARSYTATTKQWIISMDFGFTQPPALEYLSNLPKSQVRIFDAKRVLKRPMLRPVQAFHPKVYSVDGNGHGYFAAVIGSGNLTKGGLGSNVEAGALLIDRRGGSTSNSFRTWWDELWANSIDLTPLLLDQYKKSRRYSPIAVAPPGSTPAEAEATPAILRRPPQARAGQPALPSSGATHLWFEMWNLPVKGGRPGGNLNGGSKNQADLPKQGNPEEFFGLSLAGKAKGATLGLVTFRSLDRNKTWPNMWVNRSINDQIRIMLPTVDKDGWDYDETVAVITKTPRPHEYLIDVHPITSPEAAWCAQVSAAQNALIQTPGGRKWGLFSL